jgi:hypothetical protein
LTLKTPDKQRVEFLKKPPVKFRAQPFAAFKKQQDPWLLLKKIQMLLSDAGF